MDKLSGDSSELKESQALDQFREWIEKHPRIKKCRTDDEFLLRFLRLRRFNIMEACQRLEKYLTTRKQFPHLFENLNIEAPELERMVTTHSVLSLRGVDSQGRIILLVDLGKMDPIHWTTVDCTRLSNLCLEHFSFDQRSQINGVVLVIDCTIENNGLYKVWTPVRLKEYVHCMEKTFPVRVQKIYAVNMSPVWTAMFQIFKIFLSEKMKSRLEIMKGWDQLFQELGTNEFPQEIGGEIPSSEIADDFKKRLLENQKNILSLSGSDIEISNSSGNSASSYDAELDSGIVGSFRKIAVD